MANTNIPNQDKSNKDTLEILSNVETYYYHCFKTLAIVLTIGLVVVGIVVPLVIAGVQSWSFDKAEKRLEMWIENTRAEVDKQQKSLIKIRKTLGNRLEDSITSTEDKMTALQNELRQQIIINVNSKGEELLQKTEKDLSEAMAHTYMRIATTLPDIPKQPYWRLIRNVVYIEAAVDYAKCDKQDELKYVLEEAESEIAIKLSKKQMKSKYLHDIYRDMYSIILQNVYDIRSIIKEKGYKKDYIFYLLESIEQEAQKACDELDKVQSSKTFYFF